MPLVTVIMPAYNRSATVGRAVRSICDQSARDWELLVVDDGSTDDTATRAAEAGAGDRRVQVERLPENRGAAAAMNHAWRRSSSPFVAILDSDDVALPRRLERQVEHLEAAPETSVLGGAAHLVDFRQRYLRTVRLPEAHERLVRRRWYSCPFIHPTVMMRREFLEVTGGYTAGIRLGEDYDLWMRGFALHRFRYANLPEPLVIYRSRRVQRWRMIQASARMRLRAGDREQQRWRGRWAAFRLLSEGLVEQTGIFALRDRIFAPPAPAEVVKALGAAT